MLKRKLLFPVASIFSLIYCVFCFTLQALNRWGYYPLILIGSWAFGTINRIHDFFEPNHKIFWLTFLDVGTSALMVTILFFWLYFLFTECSIIYLETQYGCPLFLNPLYKLVTSSDLLAPTWSYFVLFTTIFNNMLKWII